MQLMIMGVILTTEPHMTCPVSTCDSERSRSQQGHWGNDPRKRVVLSIIGELSVLDLQTYWRVGGL